MSIDFRTNSDQIFGLCKRDGVFAARLESLNAFHVILTFEMVRDECLTSLAHF